jgi:LysR family glycine cleavage system transcriptional activator
MKSIRHLRALQAFDAAASRLNISKAAEDLGVTHGAVSRQIKQLEQYLGVSLFRRLPGGVQVTTAGERLHVATQKAFTELDQGIRSTKRSSKRKSIKISLPSSLAIKWLVPKLPAFRARYPGISIYLDTDDNLVDFKVGDVDAALRFGRDVTKGLFCERLSNEGFVIVAAPSLLQEKPATPLDIAQMPLLHDKFHPHWDTWAKCAGLGELDVQSESSELPDSAVLIAAAIDGQGVILVRRILVADDLADGRLVYLSDVRLEDETPLCLVCRDGDQRSAPISILRSWLTDICSETLSPNALSPK